MPASLPETVEIDQDIEAPEVVQMSEDAALFIKLLADSNKQASNERSAQTTAFQASLDRQTAAFQASLDRQVAANEGMRKDFRIFNILMLLCIAALGGLNVAVSNGMISFTHKGDSSASNNQDHSPSFSSPVSPNGG